MSEFKNFFISFRLTWFDRIIILLLLGVHFTHILQPVKEFVEQKASPEIALIIYLLSITTFWTIYVMIFAWRQVKDVFLENTQMKITEKFHLEELYRLKGYAEAYSHIALGFSKIHQIQRNISLLKARAKITDEHISLIMLEFKDVCTHFCDGFRLITKQDDISICLKLCTEERNELNAPVYVTTMVRDNRNYIDRFYKENLQMHHIENNTAYSHILLNIFKGHDGRHFSNNNLPEFKNYRSSSFPVYQKEKPNGDPLLASSYSKYELPYKSTIVTGVYPNNPAYFDAKYLLGFLCIDSNSENAFNLMDDSRILTGMADGIYNTLNALNNLTKKKVTS